jgi:hypothetical protein
MGTVPRGRATDGAAGAGAEVGAGTAVGARWPGVSWTGHAGKPGGIVGDNVEAGAAARTCRLHVSRTGRVGKPGGTAHGAGDGIDGAVAEPRMARVEGDLQEQSVTDQWAATQYQ